MAPSTVSTMCGITMPDGRDCRNAVPAMYEFNICAPHAREVYAWLRDRELATFDPVACPLCGELSGFPHHLDVMFCKTCGNQW